MKDYQEHLEKNILKMSYRSFTQVAVLGSRELHSFYAVEVSRKKKTCRRLTRYFYLLYNARHSKKHTQHNIDVRETNHEIELLEEKESVV